MFYDMTFENTLHDSSYYSKSFHLSSVGIMRPDVTLETSADRRLVMIRNHHAYLARNSELSERLSGSILSTIGPVIK